MSEFSITIHVNTMGLVRSMSHTLRSEGTATADATLSLLAKLNQSC